MIANDVKYSLEDEQTAQYWENNAQDFINNKVANGINTSKSYQRRKKLVMNLFIGRRGQEYNYLPWRWHVHSNVSGRANL